MASITRYKDGWRAFVSKHGQRATKTHKTKREAQAWALRKEAELDRYAAGGGRTFDALAADYLERVTRHKKSIEWETRAVARLRKQVADLGVRQLSDLDSAFVARWRDRRLQTVSGSTVQREANLLRNMIKVARDEWRWQVPDGFRGVRLPQENPPSSGVWRWQQIRRILSAPRDGKTAEVQRAFHIALHTSLRLNEILDHKYDARRRVIILADSKTGAAVVPVTRRAEKLLPSAPFTVGANEASVLFSNLKKELLIDDVTFRDARASALTWLSRRMDVLTLARISRHKDIRILANTYYRESAEEISARI